jgi:hypothetical protein
MNVYLANLHKNHETSRRGPLLNRYFLVESTEQEWVQRAVCPFKDGRWEAQTSRLFDDAVGFGTESEALFALSQLRQHANLTGDFRVTHVFQYVVLLDDAILMRIRGEGPDKTFWSLTSVRPNEVFRFSSREAASSMLERLRQDYKFPRGEVRAWPDVWAEFKGEAK